MFFPLDLTSPLPSPVSVYVFFFFFLNPRESPVLPVASVFMLSFSLLSSLRFFLFRLLTVRFLVHDLPTAFSSLSLPI